MSCLVPREPLEMNSSCMCMHSAIQSCALEIIATMQRRKSIFHRNAELPSPLSQGPVLRIDGEWPPEELAQSRSQLLAIVWVAGPRFGV